MTTYLLAMLGIVVSVVLFLIGRRGTIGAAKERAVAVNSHLERILVRRLVLERHLLSETEISRLIEGKTRDHRVAATEVHSATQLLNTVYTRVMESDLVHPEQRDAALDRITPVLAQVEATRIREEEREDLGSSTRRLESTRRRIAVMAVLIAVSGALGAAFPEIAAIESIVDLWALIPMIAATLTASLALIAAVHSAFRLRESQEEPDNKREELSKHFAFEDQVREALMSLGEVSSPSRDSEQFDFLLERGSQKFVIETKMWRKPNPASVALVAQRLKRATDQIGGADAIIVIRAGSSGVHTTAVTEGVRVMTLKEFQNYLKKRTD